MFAIQSACLQNFDVELDIESLGDQLKDIGLKQIRNDPNDDEDSSKISKFNPLDFDNTPLIKIEDTRRNFHTFKIRVQETSFDIELQKEMGHSTHIIYEHAAKDRVLYVIHMCKNYGDEFCICADKYALDKHAFNDYPIVTKDDDHTLYKITVIKMPKRHTQS